MPSRRRRHSRCTSEAPRGRTAASPPRSRWERGPRRSSCTATPKPRTPRETSHDGGGPRTPCPETPNRRCPRRACDPCRSDATASRTGPRSCAGTEPRCGYREEMRFQAGGTSRNHPSTQCRSSARGSRCTTSHNTYPRSWLRGDRNRKPTRRFRDRRPRV